MATILDIKWENAGGTGCSTTKCTDNDVLTSAFPDLCSQSSGGWTGPACEIISTNQKIGTYCLKWNEPDVSFQDNGPYAAFDYDFSSAISDIYIRYYVYFSSNYRFILDLKQILLYQAGGLHNYLQFEPCWDDDNTHAAFKLTTVGDVTYTSKDTLAVTVGEWHLIEWHVVSGSTTGSVEAKFNGTTVNLRSTEGNNQPVNINTGGPFTSIRIDHTTNGYLSDLFPTAVTGDAYYLFDCYKITDDAWVGPCTLGKINGVRADKIKKVNGVLTGSLSKINGYTVAN